MMIQLECNDFDEPVLQSLATVPIPGDTLGVNNVDYKVVSRRLLNGAHYRPDAVAIVQVEKA